MVGLFHKVHFVLEQSFTLIFHSIPHPNLDDVSFSFNLSTRHKSERRIPLSHLKTPITANLRAVWWVLDTPAPSLWAVSAVATEPRQVSLPGDTDIIPDGQVRVKNAGWRWARTADKYSKDKFKKSLFYKGVTWLLARGSRGLRHILLAVLELIASAWLSVAAPRPPINFTSCRVDWRTTWCSKHASLAV